MEILGCPLIRNPPLDLADETQRSASTAFGTRLAAGFAGRASGYCHSTIGAPLGIWIRFTPYNLVPRLFPLPRERPWLGLVTWHPDSG